MDEALLLASRLTLAVAGVGGSLALVVATVRSGGGRRWVATIAAILIILGSASSALVEFGVPTAVAEALQSSYFVAFPLLAATFPDGRFVPRWSVWFVVASVVALAVDLATGRVWNASDWWTIFPVTQMIVAGWLIVHRYRRSATTPERESVRWILLGVVLTLSAFMVIQAVDGVIGDPGALSTAKASAALLPLLLGIVIGGAFPRLWNVDAAFRAVLVVLVAGWILAGVFVAVRAGTSAAGSAPVESTVWAAAAAIATAYPVIRLAMRAATWLVFRDRMDAADAVAALATALDTDDPRPVAQRVVAVAAEATGAAEVTLSAAVSGDDPVFSVSASGSAAPPTAESRGAESFPVALRGELLATLSASPRPGESELSRRDRAALAAIARHAAPALDGARSLAEARAASAALVGAREEERRRLRRELHDDLGPALSGLALGAAAIAKRAAGIDAAIAADAQELYGDIGEAVVRSREISHGLRPPVLDDLGLEAAIRARLGAGDDVRLEVAELGELPAAVDLAALRIVQEAVTNARRHAEASGCRVRIERDAAGLRIEVSDDGVGMPRTVAPGLGLRSIRERAGELGGRARVSRAAGGGTLVSVLLPIAASGDVEAAS